MIATKTKYKPPFPWFGGKSRVAPEVWRRFGNVKGYIEPFAGSAAMLFLRPEPIEGTETINDMDGFVANFWRALQADPEKVAFHADNPVNENDLHARHIWLVERKDSLQARLEGDPDWFDAKIAGWWCWGICCWIGSGFCSGDGPWRVVKKDGMRQLVHLGSAGQGVNRQLVELTEYLGGLANRLRDVRVCCGDWRRVCGGRSGNALRHFFSAGKNGPCAVFLDPPYSAEANRDDRIYRAEDLTVAHDVRKWAVEHGEDPRLRIALCGYEGEHDMPASWAAHRWKAQGGMANLSKDPNAQGRKNCRREVIYFSPHCVAAEALAA